MDLVHLDRDKEIHRHRQLSQGRTQTDHLTGNCRDNRDGTSDNPSSLSTSPPNGDGKDSTGQQQSPHKCREADKESGDAKEDAEAESMGRTRRRRQPSRLPVVAGRETMASHSVTQPSGMAGGTTVRPTTVGRDKVDSATRISRRLGRDEVVRKPGGRTKNLELLRKVDASAIGTYPRLNTDRAPSTDGLVHTTLAPKSTPKETASKLPTTQRKSRSVDDTQQRVTPAAQRVSRSATVNTTLDSMRRMETFHQPALVRARPALNHTDVPRVRNSRVSASNINSITRSTTGNLHTDSFHMGDTRFRFILNQLGL